MVVMDDLKKEKSNDSRETPRKQQQKQPPSASKSELPETSREIRASTWITLAILGSTILITMYGETMLLPAIRDVIRDFHISYSTASWILTAYLISGAVMTPIAGKLSDIYGRKKLVLIILIIYIIGISIGALSNNISVLLVARVIQGVGISMFPIAFGIIRDQFPIEKLAIGVGVFSSMFAAGSVVGLAVGGSIIQNFGWHTTFLSIVPIAIALWIIINRSIHEDNKAELEQKGGSLMQDASTKSYTEHDLNLHRVITSRRSIDVKGAITLAVTITSFLLTLTYIGNNGSSIMADLAGTVGQRHLDRHVLTRTGRRQRAPVGRAEHEGHRVGRLLQPTAQDQGSPHVSVRHVRGGVQAALDRDQRVGHVPVDLVPGSGDLGRDRVTQHLHDGGEQVLVDDRVLVLGDAERGVLVCDAGQHLERVVSVLGHQQRGVRGYRSRESALLVTLGLVASVEQITFELGVRREHPLVEDRSDVADGGTDDGQRGLDDLGGLGGKHGAPWGSRRGQRVGPSVGTSGILVDGRGHARRCRGWWRCSVSGRCPPAVDHQTAPRSSAEGPTRPDTGPALRPHAVADADQASCSSSRVKVSASVSTMPRALRPMSSSRTRARGPDHSSDRSSLDPPPSSRTECTAVLRIPGLVDTQVKDRACGCQSVTSQTALGSPAGGRRTWTPPRCGRSPAAAPSRRSAAGRPSARRR